ncbi:MAG TPA: anhydro-N-acetylmuramic acid kinase [Trueperaceae bacterium]
MSGEVRRRQVDAPAGGGELPPMTVLSLMSGTSADGVDGVLARLHLRPGGLDWQALGRLSRPYRPELRERLLRALKPQTSDVSLITQLDAEVGHAYADAAEELAASCSTPLDLIAISGQTVYHIPREDASRDWRTRSTLQVGEASLVAERCRVPVVSDFRKGDMAAGGQGAPLVPFGDLHLYGERGVNRAVHNLGGISNLTYLPASLSGERVLAFDTGPANCLMDEAAARYAGLAFDEDGALAAAGRVDERLLNGWLEHPYLRLPPPKTTGREVFELDSFVSGPTPEPADLLATLCAFTAESVAAAYREHVIPLGLDEVLLAGGGALNPTLVRMIRDRLPVPVRTFAELGYDARDREALAFAVMGYCGFHGLANVLPSATGASRPVVAGKIVDLRPRWGE